MNRQCSIALLKSALTENLPVDDETSLHRHLEECEECGAALERMAGGMAWRQEVASLLTGDELDAAMPARDEWSEVDFTVEHLEPADEPNLLGRLGGYDVLEIIGHGGMGVVLKGFDRELKRSVAIKVLAPHLAQSSLARKRFAREAQAAAAVVHPHVLAIHQVQPNGRLPFLVMPLVAGESLAGRLTAQGTLELKEILRIGMQAAAGLAAAHEQGLVHRDVKPANILLEKGVERAVLTDFGLARAADDVALTRWGIIAGTPEYMSPEQARGEPLDGRSDLFSLGCVLYEMATGVSPFRTDSTMATLRRLVDDSPQAIVALNPELPPWFIGIVDRLLEKDPSRRFNSAQEVSELLEGCLAHVQQPANVPLPAALQKPARHRVWRSSVSRSIFQFKGALAMVAVLGIGLLALMLQATEAPDIAGAWSGEEWGTVVLKQTATAQYVGTYSDTFGRQLGEIQLKWSRTERRFLGTWREGKDRFGDISVRLIGDEIRGAWTADPTSKINPATPRLADLTWMRLKSSATARSPKEERIAEALEEETNIDFDRQPLQDVIDYLKAYHSQGGPEKAIEIEFDRKALEAAGVATDTPVTKTLQGVTLKSALRLLLKDLDLMYIIQDEVLLITTVTSPANLGAFSHRVPFEVGATNLRGGDQITIDEVGGTAATIQVGNMFEIKGTYRLASRDKATLSVYITDDGTEKNPERLGSARNQRTQHVTVERGSGRFALIFYMWHAGKPHVSFYPETRGEGFGGVYFGTGDSVLRKGWWETRPSPEGEPQPMATSATSQVDPGGLSHTVPFEVGATKLRDGDQITIDEVRGTAATIQVGHVYEIKGTYRLASQDRATVSVYITDDGTDPQRGRGVPTQRTQSVTVQRGEGRFTLILRMLHGGKPHVSFYPETGGEGFGGVYFGTGDSVLKKGWWENSGKP